MRLPALSLRLQLLLSFAGLAAGSAAAIGTFAYRDAIAGIERSARRSVAAAAQSREETVVRLVQFRQVRAEGFVSSLTSICGSIDETPRVARREPSCLRAALDEFRLTEHAAAARLLYRDRTVVESGPWITVEPPPSGTLARLVPGSDDRANYVMQARTGDLSLLVRFTTDGIVEIFASNYGLGRSGEVFLTDPLGSLVTPVRYPSGEDSRRIAEIEHQLTGGCVSGEDRQVLAPDYRGVPTIHGLRAISVFGGVGCIDAHESYDEALAPAANMRRSLLYWVGGFLLAAILLSLLASAWIARPIRSLVSSARAMQAGQFDTPVKVVGPAEVQELQTAFISMGSAIRDLLSSEQIGRLHAESANRAKDDFLAVVSHELRTPLTAILGWAHLLNSGKLDPARAARALHTIERSASAQSRLIDDLLDVSRIASGTLRLNCYPMTVSSAVEAAIDAIRPRAERQHVELHADIDPAAGLVSADPQRLQQIIDNLLSNALKFTPRGGRIDVAVRRVGANVELSVRDSGIGIAPEFLPYVFDRFRQADSASTRAHGGLGLGLAIVKQLVQMHGGSVRADSEGTGRGATFVVWLPRIDALETPGGRPARPDSGREAAALADLDVLVVDDDEPTRNVVSTMLSAAGARVTTAASAAEARAAVMRGRPSVVVADIAMPFEDGLSLIRSLRATGNTADAVPAIALTALTRDDDVSEALAAGFQAHVAKPIDPRELIHTIATVARGHRLSDIAAPA
jgi:signal transduction histidine kinase/ActR/RegA family two-component response regulator